MAEPESNRRSRLGEVLPLHYRPKKKPLFSEGLCYEL